MDDESSPYKIVCRICGKVLSAHEDKVCELCRRRLVEETERGRRESVPIRQRPMFSLSTILIALTLIVVLKGLFTTSPWLAVATAAVVIPTWIRTRVAIRIKTPPNERASLERTLDEFSMSLVGSIFAAGLAGCVGTVVFFSAAMRDCDFSAHSRPIPADAYDNVPNPELFGWGLMIIIFTTFTAIFWPRKRNAERISEVSRPARLKTLPSRFPKMEAKGSALWPSTLIVTISLLTVLFGVFEVAPAVAIPLAILILPTWFRAAWSLQVEPQPTERTRFEMFVEQFFTSAVVLMLSVVGATATGLVICAGIILAGNYLPSTEGVLVAGMWLGCIVQLLVFVWLLIKYWPTRQPPQSE